MELKTEEELMRAPKALRIVGQVIKWVFLVGLVLMIGWMSLRACYQDGTAKIKRYLFTEEAARLYEEGTLSVKRLNEYNDATLSRAFYIGSIYYTEELGQFQFMIRFNRFHEKVKEILAKQGDDAFSFVLEDDLGNRYVTYEYITDKALMYRYYRVCFSGVDVSEAETLKVYVYCKGEAVDFKDALDDCVVWDYEGPSEAYRFSSAEKKAEKPTPDRKVGTTVLINESENEE